MSRNDGDLIVTNPFDQSTVCEIPFDDEGSVKRKVAAARVASSRWKEWDLSRRIRTVESGLLKLRNSSEDLARTVALQMGKPITQARGEVATFFDRAEHMISICEDALAPEVLPERTGFYRRIDRVPHGVIFEMAAWNYPLIIPVNVIIPALLSGNVVLLKHSPLTPLCGQALQDGFSDLEIPNLVTNLIMTHESTGRLLKSPEIDHVCFTGSVSTGHLVYQTVASGPRFVDVNLELGGKDPAYVASDADLEMSVAGIVDGACYNAGQSCCAVERVYVHKKNYRDFLERAKELLKGYELGDPLKESTSMGPLAQRPGLDFLTAQVGEAKSRGARLLLGGKACLEPGNFFLPTLLADVPQEARIMQEESFGPLLPVSQVSSDEEALALMQDSRFGLTASIWTRDQARAEQLGLKLDVGTVFQNRCDFLDPALPWSGVKDSGKGSSLSGLGFFHLTRPKSIHFRK